MYQLAQKKTYRMRDFFLIPFSICPVLTSVKIINRVFGALLPSLQLLVTADFIDTAIAIFNGTEEKSRIYTPLILLILMVAYTYLNWHLISYINMKAEMKLTREYRSALVEKRAKLKYEHIENNDTWDLITRICTDPVAKIQGGFDNLLSAADIIIRVVSLLIILMAQVWWAGIAIVAMSAPLFYLAVKGGREIYKASVEAQKHTRRAEYLRTVLQSRENVEERSLFGYTDQVNEQWFEKFEAARKIELKTTMKYFIRIKASSIVTVLLSLLITLVLIFPLRSKAISIGMFMSLVTTTMNLIQMMSWNLNNTMSELAKNHEYLKDLTTFMGLTETDGALDIPADSVPGLESIEFRNVSFRYPGTDKDILKGFNLLLDKNLHYAIVGVNGAGKTTLTKLLTGMYDNYEGDILINGRNLREYTQAQLKAIFAVVYQDFAKYSIPLEDNVALGNVKMRDDRRIAQAAHDAGLDDATEGLKHGMKTWLGKIREGGVDLSGGEWQKVALARCLYHPAQMRILDEPTAALDPVAESGVYEMFGRVSAGLSTLFITHRLGAARLADEIVVIADGQVAELGSHNELLKKKGIYAEMFEAQRSWYQ